MNWIRFENCHAFEWRHGVWEFLAGKSFCSNKFAGRICSCKSCFKHEFSTAQSTPFPWFYHTDQVWTRGNSKTISNCDSVMFFQWHVWCSNDFTEISGKSPENLTSIYYLIADFKQELRYSQNFTPKSCEENELLQFNSFGSNWMNLLYHTNYKLLQTRKKE